MGVTIHLYIEYSVKYENQAESFTQFAKIKPKKIYELWCLLGIGDGGVCSAPVYTPRGVPKDVSPSILSDYAEILDDNLSKYHSTMPEYLQKRLQYLHYGSNQIWVSDPDHFDSSWLTASELEEISNQFEFKEKPNPYLVEYRSIVAMLKILNQGLDAKSRVVFWFSP